MIILRRWSLPHDHQKTIMVPTSRTRPGTGGIVAQALVRGSRITGTERAELAAQLGQRYAAGESLRSIAEDTGRSFGFVHGLVKESGVDLRSRGGATRGPAARGVAPAVAARDSSGPTVDPDPVPEPGLEAGPSARKGKVSSKGKAGGGKDAKAERKSKDKAAKKSAKKGKR
jgi:hypothetical protein